MSRAYHVYHADTIVATIVARDMARAWVPARKAFERWCWEQREQGRRTSPHGFRLVPVPGDAVVHPGWREQEAG